MGSTRVDILKTFDRIVKPALESQSPHVQTAEEMLQLLESALAPLLNREGEVVGPLRREAANATQMAIALLLSSIELMPRHCQSASIAAVAPPSTRRYEQPWLFNAAASASTAAVTSRVLAFTLSPIIAIPVGVAAGYIAHSLTVAKLPASTETRSQSAAVTIDSARVIQKLRELLVQAEAVCNLVAQQADDADAAMDEMAVLEFSQAVLSRGIDGHPLSPPQLVRAAEQFLWKQGVVATHFDNSCTLEDASQWRSVPDSNITQPVGLCPLLRRFDKVVLVGRVAVPKTTRPSDKGGSTE